MPLLPPACSKPRCCSASSSDELGIVLITSVRARCTPPSRSIEPRSAQFQPPQHLAPPPFDMTSSGRSNAPCPRSHAHVPGLVRGPALPPRPRPAAVAACHCCLRLRRLLVLPLLLCVLLLWPDAATAACRRPPRSHCRSRPALAHRVPALPRSALLPLACRCGCPAYARLQRPSHATAQRCSIVLLLSTVAATS